MATPFGSMYFCPGQDVLVIDQHGDWIGRIRNIDTGPGAEAVIGVQDPRDNPYRWPGQRVVCHWQQLRVHTPDRWAQFRATQAERFPSAAELEAERHGAAS